MSQLDRSQNILRARVVYWGPAAAGKTSTLVALRRFVDPEDRLRLYSIANEQGSTRFFDVLALDDFTFGSYRVRARVVGVPGDDARNPAREALLDGVDAIVFVADSRRGAEEANIESLRDLATALRTRGVEPATIPTVWALNRRDEQDALSVGEMRALLGCGDRPVHETVATEGRGVFECFTDAFRCMMGSLTQEHGIVGPDVAGAVPSRLLQQLSRGGKAVFARPKDADERHVVIRIEGSDDAPYGVQATEAQLLMAEAHADADATNRMLEGRNRELMAINRVARSILSAMDPDNLLVVLLDATAEYLGVTHASCVVFDPTGQGQLRSHVRGFGRDPVLEFPESEAQRFFALMQNSDGPIPASEEHNPRLLRALRRVDRRVHRALFQSIRGNNGKAAGWLGIYVTEDVAPLTTQRLLFLSSISRLAALGLEKIGLFDEMRGEAERLEQQLSERTTQLEMANARLRAMNRGLESRVTERTRALEESNRALREARAGAIHSARLTGMGHLAASFAQQVSEPLGGLDEGLDRMRDSLDELRAALAPSVQGDAEAMRVLDDFERILEESHGGARRISGLLDSLRRFGGQGGEREAVGLNAAVADAVTLLDERIHACADLDLRLGTLPELIGDSLELSHVVLALVTNAVEAMEKAGKRGRLCVSTFASRSEITLMVQDTGCGIDRHLMPRIFEAFVTTKENDQSAGTGLHSAYKAVENHGGSITVRSKPGQGTTVKVKLPCAVLPTPDAEQKSAAD